MTTKEALEVFSDIQLEFPTHPHLKVCKNINDVQEAFKTIKQALTELEEFKKRDTPTTPFHITSTYEGRVGNCPHCNKLVDELTVDAFNRSLHICSCGQKLDWKEK